MFIYLKNITTVDTPEYYHYYVIRIYTSDNINLLLYIFRTCLGLIFSDSWTTEGDSLVLRDVPTSCTLSSCTAGNTSESFVNY